MKQEPPIEVQFKPKGCAKNFLVQIPAHVVSTFQNLDPGDEADIVESLAECYRRLNEEWSNAELKPIMWWGDAQWKFFPPLDRFTEGFPENFIKQSEAANNPAIKKEVLRLVRYSGFGGLNPPQIAPLLRLAVLQAIREDDEAFFKALGRVLDKPRVFSVKPKDRTGIEKLLLEHWISQTKTDVQLCCFTDQAVDDFFRAIGISFTLDAVRKARQRLGLRAMRRKLIKSVERRGNIILLGSHQSHKTRL